jgi:hypothetical protein
MQLTPMGNYPNTAAVRRSLGLDLRFSPAGQKQKTPFGARTRDRNYQQRLDIG